MSPTPIKHPQEIEVWYILPAIRRELAGILKKKFSQREVAQILGITPSAVSQYVNKKRGSVNFPADVSKFILTVAGEIKDSSSGYKQVQRIVEYIKSSKALCRIHAGLEDGLDGCDICYQGV